MSELSSNRQNRGWLKLILFIFVCAAAGAAYVSYANEGESPKQSEAPNSPPPPVAEIITLKSEEVRIWTRFSGRLSAVDKADIKPLVGGELQQVLFDDGQLVEKNDLLFVIDPRPYKAALASAEAQLASAKSRATLAKDELVRAERLVKDKLVSESVFDAAKNEN
jgi:multidrug efflux system membrane fusion protein